ncbi:flagellar hook-length control protein FliK [Chengkuizengella axinellae]|uniref:Flagellar hook-length control protein FliK n=1 Tax=Chengkuizengella axinellae TaxID=3064388 RepID=A0ABT9IVR3_9BACL|nr:flagellar hook-length control protein FliK [Chengkuizengella sp. 2205SS18-9]MDP5273443.1 flagellar hook-length control protein FliK [Chengkuizengella sp. 2205SS18-9]
MQMMQMPLIHNLSNGSNPSMSSNSSNVNANSSSFDFLSTLKAIQVVSVENENILSDESATMDELLQALLSEVLALDQNKLTELINKAGLGEDLKLTGEWLEDQDLKQSLLFIHSLFAQLTEQVQENAQSDIFVDNAIETPFDLIKLIQKQVKSQNEAMILNHADNQASVKFNLTEVIHISPETVELINKWINGADKKTVIPFFQSFNLHSKTTALHADQMMQLSDQELTNILEKTLKTFHTKTADDLKVSLQNEQVISTQTQFIPNNQTAYQSNAASDQGLVQFTGNQVSYSTLTSNVTNQITNSELTNQSIHAQKFTQDMSQFVFKTIRFSQFNGIAEARISLVPEQLGHVDVHLKLENGQLITQFMTDKLIGKEMIESQLPQLRQALQNLGIQVDKVEVVHNDSSPEFFQGGQNQQFSQQFKQQDHNSDKYETFLEDVQDDDLETDMIEQGFITTNGRAFDVTA